ncbi:hypothetical protein F5B17DRAFT_381277 [Nemania serpens]|nr:hypothetical protein F5B17DRAFT_381277 [Nemania serpens]
MWFVGASHGIEMSLAIIGFGSLETVTTGFVSCEFRAGGIPACLCSADCSLASTNTHCRIWIDNGISNGSSHPSSCRLSFLEASVEH